VLSRNILEARLSKLFRSELMLIILLPPTFTPQQSHKYCAVLAFCWRCRRRQLGWWTRGVPRRRAGYGKCVRRAVHLL